MTDVGYKPFPLIFSSKGLLSRYAIDRAPTPDSFWFNHANAELSRQENAINSKVGRHAITQNGTNNLALADTNIHTLGRLKGLLGATYRYAGAGANLYRRTGDTDGGYATINGSVLSGKRFSIATYRPNLSSYPYAFFADASAMLKDNGTLAAAQQMGIFPPLIPPTASLEAFAEVLIDDFESVIGSYTLSGFSSSSILSRINTTLGTAVTGGQISTVTPAAMTNILPGCALVVDSGGPQEVVYVISVTKTTFTAFFANSHTGTAAVVSNAVQGGINANSTATITRSFATSLNTIAGQPASDSDIINLFLKISDPSQISEIRLLFDVGDGSFTQNYYWKSIVPSSIQDSVQNSGGGQKISRQAITDLVFSRAGGQIDNRGPLATGPGLLGDILPPDVPGNIPPKLRGAPLSPGQQIWSRIQVKRGEFVNVGLAGQPGFDWSAVNAWRISFVTIGSVSVAADDLYLYGGSGPDVFGGVPYDYRITFYNANTGGESNPSQEFVSTSFVSPSRQPVFISWTASSDSQVTHVRIYRRGGTLPTNWLLVGQVAVGTTTFTDVLPDENIASSSILALDNDVPVTSTLPVSALTTLSAPATAGSTQTLGVASTTNLFPNQVLIVDPNTTTEEIVYIQSVGVGTITAFFQFAHSSGATITATTKPGQGLNLMTIAFDKAWFAGDPNNPHYLYYSKQQNPESVPPQNFVEVGNPSDPIMAMMEFAGQLFVFTMKTIYQMIGANIGGVVPLPFKTSVKHGLFANFAWTEVEGEIWYLSYDGVYAFNGAESVYRSEPIQWLFTGQNLGPVSPMDTTNHIGDTLMKFFNNEVFVSYIGMDANRHRVSYHLIYKRWRNDDDPVNSLYVEEDTAKLLYGDTTGMIYQDRTGFFNDAGFSGGVQQVSSFTFNLQTFCLDQGLPKNPKVYQEFTIDIDTQGQTVNVFLLFDYGATSVSLGTVNTAGRQQVDFSIQGGQGQLSRNVAIKLTAVVNTAITSPITVYEAHFKALVEAELRKTFDTYFLKFGYDSWKILKQCWVEFEAQDAAGITFSVYLDGSTSPAFSFTLPQTSIRTTKRIRFPANKAKTWRFVGTSSSDFQIYDESSLEWKPVTTSKGYQKERFQASQG